MLSLVCALTLSPLRPPGSHRLPIAAWPGAFPCGASESDGCFQRSPRSLLLVDPQWVPCSSTGDLGGSLPTVGEDGPVFPLGGRAREVVRKTSMSSAAADATDQVRSCQRTISYSTAPRAPQRLTSHRFLPGSAPNTPSPSREPSALHVAPGCQRLPSDRQLERRPRSCSSISQKSEVAKHGGGLWGPRPLPTFPLV